MIETLKRCVVIGVGSVGVDMVDIEAATAAGIVVTNVPDVFIEEVADHAMMLLLDVARLTPLMARMAREGEWYEARPILSRACPPARPDARPLRVRQRRAVHRPPGHGLRPARASPTTPTSASWRSSAAGVEPVGFGELLERSDYLSVHAPHNDRDRARHRRRRPAPDEADGRA